jgi:hypothetical protein
MVENLKDLEKFLKLIRKQGVTETSISGMSFKLGELPLKQSAAVEYEEEIDIPDPLEGFPDGILTQEELAFFANGGLPEDNPYRERN